MASRRLLTTENVFLLSGILVVLVYWVADLYGALTAEHSHDTADSGTLVTRMNVVFFAMGFSLLGLLYEQHARLMSDTRWSLRIATGYLLLIDGLLHLFAFNDHLDHPLQAAFFGVLAPVQILAGVTFPSLWKRFDLGWLTLTGFLLATYVATRTTVVWPLESVEEPDALGLVSKGVEIVTILVLLTLLRIDRGHRLPTAASEALGTKS